MSNEIEFGELLGKVLIKIDGEVGDDTILFTDDNERSYELYHEQDCCEHVSVEDIIGELSTLLNSPIIMAEEVTSEENPNGVTMEYQESFIWTFYKLATIKGYVTIRWYSESNGYYSEEVSFRKL